MFAVMTSSDAPPSGRRGGYRTVSILTGLVLVISMVICGLLTRAGLSFAHEVTCGGDPPTAWRQSVILWGLGIYGVVALASLSLLVWGKRTSVIFALIVAAISCAIPILAFLIPVLASGLC